MTKKYMIKLADAIKRMPVNEDGTTINRDSVIKALADFCAEQNYQFKRDRWHSYIAGECGQNGGAVR